ncbi:MAG: group II intron maturase-specific domain-containing protein [Salinibacter sp.]
MTHIPQEAKEYIRNRIKEAMGGGTDVSARLKLKSVNAVVRGWANYYKYCTEAAKAFNDVGHHLWIRTIDWLCRKYECSKSRLIQRKLDNKIPIRINGVTLVDLNGMSTIRTESPRKHSHPYLDKERGRPPESQWGKSRRTEHPGPDPYLANSEEREGSEDVAFEARLRDGNECQAKGCDAGGMNKKSLPVHHIRRRRSEDDDRLENMVTLCRRCHRKHHHTDQVVKVHLPSGQSPPSRKGGTTQAIVVLLESRPTEKSVRAVRVREKRETAWKRTGSPTGSYAPALYSTNG